MINSILVNLGMLLLRAAEENGSGNGLDTSWLRNGDAGPMQPLIELVKSLSYGIWQLVMTIGLGVAAVSFVVAIIFIIASSREKNDHKSKIPVIICGVIFIAASAGVITAAVKIGTSVDKSLENSNYGESRMLLEEPDAELLYADQLCGGELLG